MTRTELGVIGQLICADCNCPETSRILAIKGTQILCLSMGGFRVHWKDRELMDPVRFPAYACEGHPGTIWAHRSVTIPVRKRI